jgi:hypothetical protein
MDLAPLLYVVRVTKRHLLLLIRGLLLAVSAVSTVSAISPIIRVDCSVILLLLCGPLATRLKKSSPCFGSLDAYVRDCEQMGHRLRLLYGDLLRSLNVADSITKSVDDLDVLYIQDSIPDVAETFHVVPDALIMLLPDGI